MKVKYRSSPGSAAKWAVLRWFDIPSKTDPEAVYLRRLRIIQTPWFGVYLHWINEPDSDRDLHNHPWVFWSYVLRGGYQEQVALDTTRNVADITTIVRHQFTVHKMSLVSAHTIDALLPNTLTMVVVGRRVREWGFFAPSGFVVWRDYLGSSDFRVPGSVEE